ncbi:MAG: response regulator [Candidatus Ornithomonoglobus sp.]
MNKVMICDDEVFIRNILALNVEWEKYDLEVTTVVGNGIDGYKSFCINPVDIIITDIRMPRMSGIEMSRRIREIDKHVEIIFLSSYDEFEYAKSAIEIGVCDYVLKPIQDEAFEKAICRAVSKLNEKDGKQPHDEKTGAESEEDGAQSQIINEVNKYIERNINKRLTIKGVAEVFHYSPNYLGHIFYETMGMHFGDYIIKCKMERAEKLLRVSQNQIGEVAASLGYEHITHFIRHFKNYWGVTPNTYRNNAINGYKSKEGNSDDKH